MPSQHFGATEAIDNQPMPFEAQQHLRCNLVCPQLFLPVAMQRCVGV